MKKTIFTVLMLLFTSFYLFSAIPNLLGTWSASAERISSENGFTETAFGKIRFVISEQNGKVFRGYKEYLDTTDSQVKKENFSGSLNADNTKIYIAEHEDGYIFGDIVTENGIFMYYLESETDPQAIYLHLIRETTIPNLTGKWESETLGAHHEDGNRFSAGTAGIYYITGQNGHVFTGYKEITTSIRGIVKEYFSGTISYDGKNLYIAEHDDGYTFGEIISGNEIFLNYVEDSDGKALCQILRKSK